MNNTPTVIYHSADFDGLFCREIARKFIPNATFIGWNFGDPKVSMPAEGDVYIMDLSPDCMDNPALDPNGVIWIDHHKSSIEKYAGHRINGYRIDGVAACRLAWQWFMKQQWDQMYPCAFATSFPKKEDYVNRNVGEPCAVTLAGEYDIWDRRDPMADVFQYGLRCQELTGQDWENLLNPASRVFVNYLLEKGKIAKDYATRVDASICNDLTWLMEWEGLKFLCVNHARFNSLLFAAKDKPETGHDALLGFRFDGKNWMVSLYHAAHRKDLDLSKIAVKYGGGGHAGACGFTCKELPF